MNSTEGLEEFYTFTNVNPGLLLDSSEDESQI